MKINDRLFDGYENTKLISYYGGENLPNTVPYENLPDSEVSGILKANYYKDGKLTQIYTRQENHAAVIAATRLGKTTSYVIPTVLSFAHQKIKRSMVITDPKGEVYRYTKATLEKQGYKIKLLNFRDCSHSECWNPLTPVFRKYAEIKNIYGEVELVDDNGTPKNKFKGKIYENQNELDKDIENEKRMRLDSVETDLDNFANMIIVTEAKRDPTWEDGARDLLRAFLHAMLEDADLKTNPITEDTFSLNTVFAIEKKFKNTDGHYDDGGYFSSRPDSSKAKELAKNIILDTASATRSSYVSVFKTKMSEYTEITTRKITACNSFEMSELVTDGPVAVFIDFRDELKAQFKTIGLFIQDMYKYLIEQANTFKNGKLPVPWYFVLDEFGNFAKMKDFETTISACAGRNIFFILIMQSYAQLNNIYGRDVAEIIRDNLNVHVFLGSNNPATLEEFSKECGQYTRLSPLTALNGKGAEPDSFQIETIPLITKSRLSYLGEGECIVTEANCGYVMLSKLERYYKCPEFNGLPESSETEYVSKVNPLDKRYNYDFKAKPRKYW